MTDTSGSDIITFLKEHLRDIGNDVRGLREQIQAQTISFNNTLKAFEERQDAKMHAVTQLLDSKIKDVSNINYATNADQNEDIVNLRLALERYSTRSSLLFTIIGGVGAAGLTVLSGIILWYFTK